jgi:hypothetical protein
MDTEQRLADLNAAYRKLGDKILDLPSNTTQAETDQLITDRQNLSQQISRLEQQTQQ